MKDDTRMGMGWSALNTLALLSASLIAAATAQDTVQDTASSTRIDLSHWKLTLPVDANGNRDGHASEVSAAELDAGFHDSYFNVDANSSLVFWCPVVGAKTEGTEFPRSELREMLHPLDPSVNWTTQGTHTLSARCIVTEVPSSSKVIVGQIHGHSGKAMPLVKLQYHKGRIEALVKSSPTKGEDIKLVWPAVGLGNVFSYQIKLQDGHLSVTVNDIAQSENILENDPAWAVQSFYFKAGAYCQDNEGPASEGARVTFLDLDVSHAGLVE